MMHWARGWVTKEGGGLQLSALMVDLTPLCQKRNIQGHWVWVRTLEQTSKLPHRKVHELTIRRVAHRQDLPGNLFSLLWNVLHPTYGRWQSWFIITPVTLKHLTDLGMKSQSQSKKLPMTKKRSFYSHSCCSVFYAFWKSAYPSQ